MSTCRSGYMLIGGLDSLLHLFERDGRFIPSLCRHRQILEILLQQLVLVEGKNHCNALSMLISDIVLFYRAQFFLPPVYSMEGVSYIIHLIRQGVVSRIEDPELDAPSRKTCEPYPIVPAMSSLARSCTLYRCSYCTPIRRYGIVILWHLPVNEVFNVENRQKTRPLPAVLHLQSDL